MTFKELINNVLNTGKVEETMSVICDTYYISRESPVSSIDIITGYTSVVRTLLEITPDDKNVSKYNICIDQRPGDEPREVVVNMYGISDETSYAIDLVPWRELLNMNVIRRPGCSLNLQELLGHILWEITFYGFTSSDIDREIIELKSLCDRIDSGEEELIEFNIDDLDDSG
jgi:hypothetical protein